MFTSIPINFNNEKTIFWQRRGQWWIAFSKRHIIIHARHKLNYEIPFTPYLCCWLHFKSLISLKLRNDKGMMPIFLQKLAETRYWRKEYAGFNTEPSVFPVLGADWLENDVSDDDILALLMDLNLGDIATDFDLTDTQRWLVSCQYTPIITSSRTRNSKKFIF